MISLEISDEFIDLGWYKAQIANDRPKVFRKEFNDVGILKRFYHRWLVDQNIHYDLRYEYNDDLESHFPYIGYYILFKNKNDAMYFKLTWL